MVTSNGECSMDSADPYVRNWKPPNNISGKVQYPEPVRAGWRIGHTLMTTTPTRSASEHTVQG